MIKTTLYIVKSSNNKLRILLKRGGVGVTIIRCSWNNHGIIICSGGTIDNFPLTVAQGSQDLSTVCVTHPQSLVTS